MVYQYSEVATHLKNIVSIHTSSDSQERIKIEHEVFFVHGVTSHIKGMSSFFLFRGF